MDGAYEIMIYENAATLFVPNILSFCNWRKIIVYGAIRCPLEFWHHGELKMMRMFSYKWQLVWNGKELSDLMQPQRLLDIMQKLFFVYY
jgi:type I restriction enzyme R subunit